MQFIGVFHSVRPVKGEPGVSISESLPPPTETAVFIFLEFSPGGVIAWYKDEGA